MAKKKASVQSTKKPRSEAQISASLRNIAKAREAKKKYETLRKQGFTRDTIYEATRVINNILSNKLYSSSTNPAVAALFSEIGEFKTEEEISAMSKGEYYKYATSIRSFLGNPLSAEEAADYLNSRLTGKLISASLIQGDDENRRLYLQRRQSYIEENDEISRKAFELYRRITEENAGQIIRNKIAPAAYGSENLIVDLFEFVDSGQWYDEDMNAATRYWSDMIEKEYSELQEKLRNAEGSDSLEMKKFDWKAGETYGSFIRRTKKL